VARVILSGGHERHEDAATGAGHRRLDPGPGAVRRELRRFQGGGHPLSAAHVGEHPDHHLIAPPSRRGAPSQEAPSQVDPEVLRAPDRVRAPRHDHQSSELPRRAQAHYGHEQRGAQYPDPRFHAPHRHGQGGGVDDSTQGRGVPLGARGRALHAEGGGWQSTHFQLSQKNCSFVQGSVLGGVPFPHEPM